LTFFSCINTGIVNAHFLKSLINHYISTFIAVRACHQGKARKGGLIKIIILIRTQTAQKQVLLVVLSLAFVHVLGICVYPCRDAWKLWAIKY